MGLFLAYFALAIASQGSVPSRTMVERAVERLDLWSFQNSMRDRLRAAGPRTRTLRQLGPQRFQWRDGVLEAREADGSWVRSFRPLRSRTGRIRLCFYDRARNGGSYRARQALELSPARGLYRARQVADRDCGTFPPGALR